MILALLAGQGLQLILQEPDHARRWLKRFCLTCLLVIGVTIGLIELSARQTGPRPGQNSPLLGPINQARQLFIPAWTDRQSLEDWVRRSRATDAAAIPAYAKPYTNLSLTSFNRDRVAAYKTEVLPQVLLIVALLAFAMLAGQSPLVLRVGLGMVMMADLAMLSRLRSIETAPLQAVASQSPVMARLGQLAEGHSWPLAVWGDLGNLPMAVGASPIKAYRTMDMPVMPEVNDRLMRGLDEKSLALARLAGIGVLLFDPPTWALIRGKALPDLKFEEINDPTLWAWMTTSPQAAKSPTTFGLVHLAGPLARAWRVSLPAGDVSGISEWTSPKQVDQLAQQAKPLEVTRDNPETVQFKATTTGPELWLISQWAAPGWQAILNEANGPSTSARIIPMAGGWQGVEVPAAGTWTLGLRYIPSAYPVGFWISLTAWAVVLAAGILTIRKNINQNNLTTHDTEMQRDAEMA